MLMNSSSTLPHQPFSNAPPPNPFAQGLAPMMPPMGLTLPGLLPYQLVVNPLAMNIQQPPLQPQHSITTSSAQNSTAHPGMPSLLMPFPQLSHFSKLFLMQLQSLFQGEACFSRATLGSRAFNSKCHHFSLAAHPCTRISFRTSSHPSPISVLITHTLLTLCTRMHLNLSHRTQLAGLLPPRSPLPAQRQRADQSTGEEGLSPGDSRETRDTDTSTDTGEDTTRTEASTEIRESTDDGRTTDTGTGTGGGTAGLRVAEGPGLEGAGRVGLDRGEEASRGRTSERIRTPR
jgi:hypothetical protein